MSKIIYIIALFIICSCANISKNTDANVQYQGIEFENKQLEDTKAKLYVTEENVTEKISPKKIRALFVDDGGYQTINSLEIVQFLLDSKIDFSIYSGTGWGALVAAYLAQNKSLNFIHWKLYSAIEKLRQNEYISNQWIKNYIEFASKEFDKIKFEQLNKTLIVPIHDIAKKENIMIKNGDITNILTSSMQLQKIDSGPFQSASGYNFWQNYLNELNKSGVDEIYILKLTGKITKTSTKIWPEKINANEEFLKIFSAKQEKVKVIDASTKIMLEEWKVVKRDKIFWNDLKKSLNTDENIN